MTIALVTGGSQGVGRGVVEGLAEAGFTVFFTGRDGDRLEQVAADATTLGGAVHARRVDHRDDAAVEALSAELADVGGADLLVNSVWGGYENMLEQGRWSWSDPYWEQPLWRWDAMLVDGVRAAFVAARLATPSMLERGRGLIVNLSYWAARKHLGNALYGIAKAATDKMSADMAVELQGRGVDVVSLYPGLVRTEKVLAQADYLDLSSSESPRFIGRTIAALWGNPHYTREHTGEVCVAAACARALGVRDVDGSSPRPLTLADV